MDGGSTTHGASTTQGNGGEAGARETPGPAGASPTRPPAQGAPVPLPGPDVQRLGRWAAVCVTVAIVAIFVVMILSAMR